MIICLKLKKISMYIDLLAEYGLMLNEPYIKKLDKEKSTFRAIFS